MPITRSLSVAVVVLMLAAACRRSREAPAPVIAPPPTRPEIATTPIPDPDADRNAREAAAREARARAERARILTVMTEAVQFAFDRSDLTMETRSKLDTKLEILRANPTMHIRIYGHADDRGSGEYNLALGKRRAAAAKRYLVQRDIEPERIEITSYGEERPLCQMQDEICWQMNRRDEFEVVSQ